MDMYTILATRRLVLLQYSEYFPHLLPIQWVPLHEMHNSLQHHASGLLV